MKRALQYKVPVKAIEANSYLPRCAVPGEVWGWNLSTNERCDDTTNNRYWRFPEPPRAILVRTVTTYRNSQGPAAEACHELGGEGRLQVCRGDRTYDYSYILLGLFATLALVLAMFGANSYDVFCVMVGCHGPCPHTSNFHLFAGRRMGQPSKVALCCHGSITSPMCEIFLNSRRLASCLPKRKKLAQLTWEI